MTPPLSLRLESHTESRHVTSNALAALHWLGAEDLVRVYRQVGAVMRPGGVFLNGDHLTFGPHMQTFQQVAEAVKERARQEAFVRRGLEDWQGWWEALAAEPALQELLAERERRFAWKTSERHIPIFELHEAALRDVGFREVGVIWQYMGNRVLMGVR